MTRITAPELSDQARDLVRRALLPDVLVETSCACACRCHSGWASGDDTSRCYGLIEPGQVDCEYGCRDTRHPCDPFRTDRP